MSGLLNPKSNLQLYVTRRCQLLCTYCPVVKGPEDMPLAVALKGVDFLLGSRHEDLALEFYGGEPLLAFDVLRESAEYALKRARGLGKRMSFYVATNSLLLDRRKLDWMAKRNFCVALSWDGAPETHNRERTAPGGLDTYAAPRRIIAEVLRSGVTYTVIPVATPGNVKRLAENVEHLFDLGVRSIDLNYQIGVEWDRRAQEEDFAQIRRVVARHRRELASGGLRLGNLRPESEPGVINPDFTVAPDGTIRQLSEWLMEVARPGAPTPRALGSVMDAPAFDSLYLDRFHCAYALFAMYARDARQRRILLNNIAFGRRHKEFFAELQRRLTPSDETPRASASAHPRGLRDYPAVSAPGDVHRPPVDHR